jgi:crossover junction endodeoxyribonuclease RusA
MNTQPMKIDITLPWPPKQLSPNARMHHMALHRAKKAYRAACAQTAIAQGVRHIPAQALRVSLEFVPPTVHRRDADNLVASMKSGLDGLADALGVDDKLFQLGAPVVANRIGGMVHVCIESVEAAQ